MSVPAEHPPYWGEALISLFAPARGRDGLIGDLLEEYHDEIVPARGLTAADRWFGRRALGFLWRASLPTGLVLAGTLLAQWITDLTAPPDLAARVRVGQFVMMAFFVWQGFRLGRRTGRIPGAVFSALAGTAIGTVIAYAIAFVTTGVGGLYDALDIPFHIIGSFGVILSGAGATIGRFFTGSSGLSDAVRS